MPQNKKNIIIQKFGGSILANIDKIKELPKYIEAELALGNFPIVVVSALFGATNNLLLTCNQFKEELYKSNSNSFISNNLISSNTIDYNNNLINSDTIQFDNNLINLNTIDSDNNLINLDSASSYLLNNKSILINLEIDVALSTLETFASSILAMCLLQKGIKAKSIQGWQLPILTDSNYNNAHILSLKKTLLNNLLSNNIVPIISGFQGIDLNNNITTLGRGGSDITALAIAKIMKAKRVDIYKDVVGIMSADPKIVKNTRLIQNIDYEIMYYMSFFGVKALNARSCEIAMRYKIPIKILSNYVNLNQEEKNNKLNKSTLIMNKKNNHIERTTILNITQNSNITGIKIQNNIEYNSLLKELIDHECNMLKITDNYIIISNLDISLINKLKLNTINDLIYITIIGFGLTNNLVIKEIFNIAKDYNIAILDINITGINIIILVQGKNIEYFIQKAHENFIEKKFLE
ncbi:MAG: aspartate kinase [Rickettsiales bacterium]